MDQEPDPFEIEMEIERELDQSVGAEKRGCALRR